MGEWDDDREVILSVVNIEIRDRVIKVRFGERLPFKKQFIPIVLADQIRVLLLELLELSETFLRQGQVHTLEHGKHRWCCSAGYFFGLPKIVIFERGMDTLSFPYFSWVRCQMFNFSMSLGLLA